jgi:hypothetical protein
LGVEGRIVEDGVDQTSTIDGRVRIHGADQNLQLAFDVLGLSWGRSEEGECSNALTIQSEVLGKRLAKSDLVTVLDEQAYSLNILLGVAASKTLVGAIEKYKMVLLLANL